MAIKGAMELRDALVAKLREPEERRWQLKIDQLVEQNAECDPSNTLKGFMYSGERYVHSQVRMKYRSYPMLSHQLWAEMDAHLLDISMHDLNFSQAGQMIWRLLYECNDVAEIRNNLPECLVSLLKEEIKAIPRTFREAYLLYTGADERAKRQFEELLPMIEGMVVTRMLM